MNDSFRDQLRRLCPALTQFCSIQSTLTLVYSKTYSFNCSSSSVEGKSATTSGGTVLKVLITTVTMEYRTGST